MQRIMAGIIAALVAGPAAAATIAGSDGGSTASTTGGWIDPGDGAPTTAPLALDSRGYYGFVVVPDTLHGSIRFTGDADGLVNSNLITIVYTLRGVADLPAALPAAGGPVTAASPAATATVYGEAGSGPVYGTVVVAAAPAAPAAPVGGAPAAPTAPVVITLNAAGTAAVGAAATAGTPFVVGLSASAAPEPAAWLLMVAGFGLVGAARRRAAVAA